MSLWVPPTVSRELRQETARDTAELSSRARQREVCKDFDADLKRIDPRLQMVWFDADVNLLGVIPARYHLIRVIPDGPPTIIPICGPDGGFIEPNSGLFEWLRKHDMWNHSAAADRKRARDEAERARQRCKERETEDRLEELKDRFNAHFRTSISMNDSASWSQNAQGHRGRKVA